MSKFVGFIKDWMLPISIATGICTYLLLHFVPSLSVSAEPAFSGIAKDLQPVLVAVMLFLQFTKISPHDLRFRRWHIWLLLFQAVMFVVPALICTNIPHGNARILVECAMLCFVCPTAAAAGVITDKLGGSLSDTVTYVVLINILAAFIIPLVIPVVHPSADISFWSSFFAICKRVFPLLVFPLLVAWLIRYTIRPLQEFLIRYAHWAFYIWGITLCLSIYLATKALINSGIPVWLVFLICLVSLACCLIQFIIGRKTGTKACKEGSVEDRKHDSITAGQALGQKNAGFLIWLGFSYMTPVTSVAGGLYSIWQNLVNSLELYQHRHGK
ncbi:MAG: bile acid:sodium symporter [Bacteroidales bacterium]|nr:bile acid:sodium symporter [Bacteroidales bacterium]